MKVKCAGCDSELETSPPQDGQVRIRGTFMFNCGTYSDGEQCIVKASNVEFCGIGCFNDSILEEVEKGKELVVRERESNSSSR